jgi:hypothetical protein
VYSLLDEVTSVVLNDDDLTQEWESATGAVLVAIASPDLAKTLVKGHNGRQPFSTLVSGLLTIDTLCHTWDLARAIGAGEDLDSNAVDNAYIALSAVGDLICVPGGYGPAITGARRGPPDEVLELRWSASVAARESSVPWPNWRANGERRA